MSILSSILVVAILVGQLIKFPTGNSGGVTILDVVVLALCITGIVKSRLRFTHIPLFFKASLVFTLITIFSLIFTPLHLTLSEYLISSSYIFRFILYLSFGFLIYIYIFPKIKQELEKILLYSGLGLSIIGLLQFIFIPDLGFLQSQGWDPHVFRTFSTLLDPNFLGAYLILSFLLILSKLNFPLKFNKSLIIPLFIYLALLTTFSRSSYLDFLISGVILGIFKKSWSLFFLTLALFIGLLIGFQTYTILVSTPRNINRTYSADARLNTWQQGIDIFQKNPLLGSGFNTYRYALIQEQLAKESFANERGGSSNDSSLLHVLATTGILGFISYMFFLFTLLKSGVSNLKTGGVILISLICGLLIHSIFNNSLFYPHIMLWIFLMPTIVITNSGKNY